jgi:glycosyltransferase involved in cell wall biosynthesis
VRVLVSAYACEPAKGSEPGAGWNWALAAARRHEVWVMTRANNRPAIEEALARNPISNLHFEYIDLPSWARSWKRGPRGARLYYLLWQILAAARARRLQRERNLDVVHHLTFANLWLPALACAADAPFVLGPVGGGQRVPLRLYPALGLSGAVREVLLLLARRLARLSPPVRLGWRRAAVILVNNEETRAALPRRHRSKTVVRPNACVPDGARHVRAGVGRAPSAVYAGRLNRFKGVSLAIEALRLAPRWTLTIIGEGPDAARLARIARRSDVADRVRFVPWLPQQELWREIASSQALLLPSLKEGASFVSVEAQALGVPVVAFAASGASVLAGAPGASFELVRPSTRRECARDIAHALARLEVGSPRRATADHGLERVAEDIDLVYRAVAGRIRASEVLSEGPRSP